MTGASPSPSTERATRGGVRIGEVVAVLLAVVASLALHGYVFGIHNHEIQIPHLRWMLDDELYGGDALIESMRGYFSWAWPGLAALARRFPMETVFYVLHVLTAGARYAAVLAIGRRLFPREPLAPFLGLWLVFWGESGVGAEALNWFYFTHTPLATAIGLWAVWCGLSGRFLLAFALAGVVFDVHAMQGAYLVMLLGCAQLFEGGGRTLQGLVRSAAVFALTAAPGLVWMLGVHALAADPEFVPLIRAFFPYHFFPSSFRIGQWIGIGLYGALFCAFVAFLREEQARRRALWMAASILLFWLVGGAAAELRPSPFVVKLHVFRSSAYLAFLAFPLAAGLALRVLRARFDGASFALALAATLAVTATLGSADFVDPTRPVIALTVGASLVGLALAALVPPRQGRVAATLAALIALVPFSTAVSSRYSRARALVANLEPWRALQEWARDNTPRDAVFLTPPYLSGFRVFSERSVVGEWRDGAAILWDAEFGAGYRDLLEELGAGLDPAEGPVWERLARGWFAQGQPALEALAARRGARYVVVRKPTPKESASGYELPWNGVPIHEVGPFSVYAVP